MKLDTFFDKFELFANAPNAVQKMRELVLDLAATSRLLPASDKWETRALKSLATKIGSGATPAGGRESYFSKGIPLIRSMNVHFRGFDPTGLVFLSNEQADELSSVAVQPNDVLLNITGASIGRVTIAPTEMAGARVNQHVTIIRPTLELLPRFLSVFLASPSVQGMIDEIQVGATRQALTKGMIEQFSIPLPPLAEQKNIVAKVDELMALCDRLEAQQQQRAAQHSLLARAAVSRFADAPTPANLNFIFHNAYTITPADLRKSILTLAVQGKLVPQDPNDEFAAQFVYNLQTKRKQAFDEQTKLARSTGGRLPKTPRNGFIPHVVEDADDLPIAWCEARVGDICECLDYLRVPVNKSERLAAHGTVPYYGANGQVGWIDKYLFDEDLVLVVEDETFIGRIKPFSYVVRGKSWVNNHAHVLRPLGGVTADFLNLVLCQYPFIPLTSGTTARRKLTQPSLMDAKFALPPLSEQCRIVAKVDELMKLVDQLEQQLEASESAAEKLMEAIVSELTAPRGQEAA